LTSCSISHDTPSDTDTPTTIKDAASIKDKTTSCHLPSLIYVREAPTGGRASSGRPSPSKRYYPSGDEKDDKENQK
jgi:hypothetical protein